MGRRSLSQLRPGLRGRVVHELPGKPGNRGAEPARDRADLLFRAAAGLRRPADQRDDPDGGCEPAEEMAVRPLSRHRQEIWREDPRRPAGAAVGPDFLLDRRQADLWSLAQRARLHPDPHRLYGGRGDRAGPVLVLPLAGHQPQAALRADRSVPLCHRAEGRRSPSRHGGAGRARRGDPDRREWRGPVQVPRHVCRLLRRRGEDQGNADSGRLGDDRRRRHLRCPGPPQDHRPGQGCRQADDRCAVCAEIHREQAQVLPQHQGGRGLRRWQGFCRGVPQHRPDRGRQLGRAQQHLLRLLPGTGGPAAGLRDDDRSHQQGEPGSCGRADDGRRADQALPGAAQGA